MASSTVSKQALRLRDLTLVLVIALVATLSQQFHAAEALQPPPAFATSRRGFMSKVATAGAVIAITGGTHPDGVWAVTTSDSAPNNKKKKESKPAFRGGKEVIDATHNGTDLNDKEAGVASGLLGKMGISDISPDKDAGSRKVSPTR